MRQRKLGNTGISVSLLGLGCNNFGLRMPIEDARGVIHKALDLGITFFDTADVYGNRGGSETALGRFVGSRRKDIFLASKFGSPMDDAGTMRGGTRQYVMSAVEASLKRLQTDWIDLYQMHRPDPKTPVEETLRALEDLVRQGKVRYTGFSQVAGWQFVERQLTTRQHGLSPVTAVEFEYSLLARDAERELIPAMQAYGVGLLPFYPLAGGFLTGKYRRDAAMPEGARLTKGRRYADRFMTDANWTTFEKLEAFSRARGHSLLELALCWLAAQPVVISVIAGATQARQVELNAGAIDWVLTPEELAEVDRLCGKESADTGAL